MVKLLVIPLAVAIVPLLIPAVRDWVEEKIRDWRISRKKG